MSDRQPIRVLRNAAEVIRLLAEEGTLSPAEIAERVGMPRPSVYRLIDGLHAVGLTEPTSDAGARLGIRWLHLADRASVTMSEWAGAHEVLEELSDRTHQTIYLSVLRQDEAVCIDWKQGRGIGVLVQWLEQGRQSPHAIRSFWQPLCLAALNTPVDSACAQLFAHVLRDSLGGAGTATDLLIPRMDLSRLWPDEAARQLSGSAADGAGVHLGCPVRQLACSAAGVTVDGAQFDAAVVAGNAPSTRKLLEQLDPLAGSDAYLAMLSAFTYLPIATLTLQLQQPWGLPRPMLLLRDDPATLQFGQWLFDRSALAASGPVSGHAVKQEDARRLLHIVISDASAMQQHPPAQIADAVARQVQAQTRRFGPMPRVTGHDLIVEKRATFAATPGLARPPVATPWPRVWVAGDWTDTGYPGVLEGAVRSGRAAARSLLQSLA